MRNNLGVALGAAVVVLTLSGCAPQVTECDLVLYSHSVAVDAGDAATVHACIGDDCASWSAGDDKPVKIDGPIFVSPADDGTLSIGSWSLYFDELTITAWNDAGVQTTSKTFPLKWDPPYGPRVSDLEWSPGPNACGWGDASTDPISL